MVSVVYMCVWPGSGMGKQHLMALSWLGEHSAGKHSEFLVLLYNGKKFTRMTPFWSMKTVALFFSSNRELLNFFCLSHIMWHHSTDDHSTAMIFPADIALLISWNLTSCCRRSCTSLFITQGSPSWFPMLTLFGVVNYSPHIDSHHKQPAVGSEFQLERLLQQSKVNHSMLLKVHQRVLSAGFQFTHNSNIAS
jgi:hypothetical protein